LATITPTSLTIATFVVPKPRTRVSRPTPGPTLIMTKSKRCSEFAQREWRIDCRVGGASPRRDCRPWSKFLRMVRESGYIAILRGRFTASISHSQSWLTNQSGLLYDKRRCDRCHCARCWRYVTKS
jgi:hypothetical protein